MKLAYLDCNAGISGNMVIGALVMLGLPAEVLNHELQKLPLPVPPLTLTAVKRKGFDALLFDGPEVIADQHRHLSDITQIIGAADLSQPVKMAAQKCFTVLAAAEAKIHGISPEEVHFHEVGALDAIIDIVGTALGFDYFQLEKVVVSPIRVGYGSINCAHGLIPLPAPATVELLKGFEIFGGDIAGEWATPTGAAIVKTFATSQGPLPAMKILQTGYGAGTQDRTIPNVLRIFLGQTRDSDQPAERQMVLETNIDDMNPELYGYLGELLGAAGARDFYLTPVQMKKGRPGVVITVVADLERVPAIETLLLTETTTLGIRKYEVSRHCLERNFLPVEVAGLPVKIKTGYQNGVLFNYAPEYEDCLKIAKKLNIPLKDVYEEAKGQARKILTAGSAKTGLNC